MGDRRITHVAIKFRGTVYAMPAPNRHHHVIRSLGGISGPDIQGFTDQHGVFLNRRDAYKLAAANGQLKRDPDPKKYQGTDLYSEDLW